MGRKSGRMGRKPRRMGRKPRWLHATSARLLSLNAGGFINLGGGGFGGLNLNRWGNSGFQQMNGYVNVDYSNGWNPNYHDQLLRNNIDIVFQRYDHNFSAQLEGQEFFFAYRDLCLMMGICPPNDYQSIWNAQMQSDSNFNGRVSKM